MPITFSASESKRFSLEIYRAEAPHPAEVAGFLGDSISAPADVVILRSDIGRMTALLPEFSRRCHTVVADQLLEYRKVLTKKTIADQLDSGASIVVAEEKDRERLARLIRRCYSEYTNHYHANPCLNTAHVLDGFIEHSLSFLTGSGRCIFLASRDGKDCGYLCMEIKDGVGSTVFGGSALDIPAPLRHKVLCDLTHHGDLWLMERGVARFMAITRTDKTYIQKLLVHNMHTLPAATQLTVHLNLFAHALASQPFAAEGAPTWRAEENYPRVDNVRFRLRNPGRAYGSRRLEIKRPAGDFSYVGLYDDGGLYELVSQMAIP